jgi:hypothetical protein
LREEKSECASVASDANFVNFIPEVSRCLKAVFGNVFHRVEYGGGILIRQGRHEGLHRPAAALGTIVAPSKSTSHLEISRLGLSAESRVLLLVWLAYSLRSGQ